MSMFWTIWISVITLGSIIGCYFLLRWCLGNKTGVAEGESMGHEFDGIEEINNPLPRWWTIMFYITIDEAEFLVVGMGRVGLGAFQSLSKLVESKVWGMDADRVKIKRLKNEGMNVIVGDGEDVDLWDNLDISNVRLVLLALPSIEDAINISNQLKNAGYDGKIAAIARYEDEVDYLLSRGVDKVFNFFTEAGLGFAEESLAFVESEPATS